MAFYYNIAKKCSLCGVSFIADFFTNEKYCIDCENILYDGRSCESIIEDNTPKKSDSVDYSFSSKFEYDSDIENLINPNGYRKQAVFYD